MLRRGKIFIKTDICKLNKKTTRLDECVDLLTEFNEKKFEKKKKDEIFIT